MSNMVGHEYVLFETLSDEELSELLEGSLKGRGMPWPHPNGAYFSRGMAVLCRQSVRVDRFEPPRPILIVLRPENERRLYGRYSQLRDYLSPVSTWCHVMSPRLFEAMESPIRSADLGNFSAAWVGLVIAEALSLADRPLSQLRIASCFSTYSYAVARSFALWPMLGSDEVVEKYRATQALIRGDQTTQQTSISESLSPIWSALLHASSLAAVPRNGEWMSLGEAVRALDSARRAESPNETEPLMRVLGHSIPDADFFHNLKSMSPERRLKQFDKLIHYLDSREARGKDVQLLSFLAGYLATVMAGGSANLSLVEASARKWPQVLAWAYVLGSLGERITWSSGFDGLGRLVARDLMRTLNLSDAPSCDFSFDEASVLIDRQLSDPFVHLRIKQSRIVTVSLFPGVNVSVPLLYEMSRDASATGSSSERASSARHNEDLAELAAALWPYLRDIDRANDSARYRSGIQKSKGSRKPASQTKLPLK